MEITMEEIMFLHALIGNLDYHLIEHIFKDSTIKEHLDIHEIGTKLYNNLDRELGN